MTHPSSRMFDDGSKSSRTSRLRDSPPGRRYARTPSNRLSTVIPVRRPLTMKSLLLALAATALLTVSASAADENPLKVLLITGGCCHDYAYQSDELKKADRKSVV